MVTVMTKAAMHSTRKRFVGECCPECGVVMTESTADASDLTSVSIDHIISKALGGSNSVHNIRVTCRQCNCNKGSKLRLVDLIGFHADQVDAGFTYSKHDRVRINVRLPGQVYDRAWYWLSDKRLLNTIKVKVRTAPAIRKQLAAIAGIEVLKTHSPQAGVAIIEYNAYNDNARRAAKRIVTKTTSRELVVQPINVPYTYVTFVPAHKVVYIADQLRGYPATTAVAIVMVGGATAIKIRCASLADLEEAQQVIKQLTTPIRDEIRPRTLIGRFRRWWARLT